MNRKGGTTGSGILFLITFVIMAIITAGIYGGLINYFGEGYDYRQREASTLLKKTKECLSKHGLETNVSVFLDKCKLSGDILLDGRHFLYVNNSEGDEISIGTADYKTRCGLDARRENRNLPLCIEFQSSENYILAASSQNARRVLA